MRSRETVIGLALGGTLEFDFLNDTLINEDGGNYSIKMEKGMGHRTPENIFKREVLFLT